MSKELIRILEAKKILTKEEVRSLLPRPKPVDDGYRSTLLAKRWQ